MAWDTDLVLMVRVLAGDLSLPQTNNDAYMKQVIVASAKIVDQDIDFSVTYTINVAAVTISPDPIANGDTTFQALVPLKAACILTLGDYKKALGDGIKVRDGDSMIDTSVGFRGYRDIIEVGPCAMYEKLKWTIQASAASSVGVVFGSRRSLSDDPVGNLETFYNRLATR